MTQLQDTLSKKLLSKSSLFLKILFVILGFAALGLIASNQLHNIKKREKRLRHEVRRLKEKGIVTDCLGRIPIPIKLANLPFAEDCGLILNVKELPIRGVTAPHNPSIIPSEAGYALFFRYDQLSAKARYHPYYSRIGVVSLNRDFSQSEKEFQKIEDISDYAEDPRILWVGDQLYLLANVLDIERAPNRLMCLANLDPQSYSVNYTTLLDLNLERIEKNWPPFAYQEKNQNPTLFFEYQITPHKILSLPDPKKNDLQNIILPRNIAYLTIPWESKWGRIRGGTPAIKIGNEYLAFFHSGFTEKNGMWWYVMGAYTFQAEPPFALTRMSKYPILFRGIFETPVIHTADHNKRVIYPSGFVLENKDGKELIHLACGENDCAIKIVTLDKKVLLETMDHIEQE